MPQSVKNTFKKSLFCANQILFGSLLLFEFLLAIWFISSKRIVGGHDAFQYFYLQYYFLNNAVIHNEIPQWIPYLNHGSIASWWFELQAGLLQNVFLLIAPLLKHFNFSALFLLSILFDKFVLLVGVWLLSRRLYKSSYTCFFVALTVLLSCVWTMQVWFNFHFYYALPLILYFIHRFFDKGNWLSLFLALNLILLQMFGNLPYFFGVITLVVFLYFLFFFLFDLPEFKSCYKRIKFHSSIFIYLILLILLALGFYYLINAGTKELVSYNWGRSPDQSIPLEVFLSYSDNYKLIPWIELISGISLAFDYTLFFGVIAITLILFGLFNFINKKQVALVCVVITLLLFSTNTPVSALFYYVWPTIKYYRHLSLTVPIIKLFLIFLCGYSFEAIFIENYNWLKNKVSRGLWLFLVLFQLLISLLIYYLLRNIDLAKYIIDHSVYSTASGGIPRFWFSNEIFSYALDNSLFYILFFLIIIALLPFIKNTYRSIVLFCVLALHFFNLFSYNINQTYLKSTPVQNLSLHEITSFQPLSFSLRRGLDFFESNPRNEFVANLKVQRNFYWSSHCFLFKDILGSIYRVDHCLYPLDQYMKAYWKQDIDSYDTPLGHIRERNALIFPLSHTAALKFSGFLEDKIQFFSKAFALPSDKEIAADITSDQYNGDILFLSNQNTLPQLTAWQESFSLKENYRTNLPFEVKQFDSNNLKLTVNVPIGTHPWLFYSDTYHSFWRAKINGKNQPVYKANLAYKAVQLDEGENVVHFYFKTTAVSLIQLLVALNSLLWVGIIFYLIGKILKIKEASI